MNDEQSLNILQVLFLGEIILFIVIILLASILQTSTGFGFSIMATPFLLLMFEAREAIQINLILSLVISCALILDRKSTRLISSHVAIAYTDFFIYKKRRH